MMSKTPLVSVGVPVYNGERFLGQTLDSILAQTFKDFELLISDNASSDRTEDICRKYAKKDTRIRYVRNATNVGSAKNYDNLLWLSSGRYFRWAPADDLFAPTSLERCVAVLEANDDVVLCYPKTILIDENGNTIAPYEDRLDLRSTNVSDRFRLALKVGRVNAIYGLMRSDALKSIAPMGNYPNADGDLLIELCLYGRFFEIPEALFFRRMHAGAYSSIATLQGLQSFLDPRTSGKLEFNHWRRILMHSRAVWRAPLKTRIKLRLSYMLARRALTARREFLQELLIGVREASRKTKLVYRPTFKKF